MSQQIDKRAFDILSDRFWSATGWKRQSEWVTSSDDFAYAKAHGVMFEPVRMNHDQAVNTVVNLVKQLDRRTVANAFLASLSTRRLDWRSAFASYAVFQHLVPHEVCGSEKFCAVCGIYPAHEEHDFSLLNFERLKWGGVRHEFVGYAAMDLSLFLENRATAPCDEDIAIFHAVIEHIRKADEKTTAASLHAAFAKTLKSNKSERDRIVAALGFCDVLADSTHPGFSDAFVPVQRRPAPHRRFVDMPYPACWWNGRMGIDETRLTEYFGHVL